MKKKKPHCNDPLSLKKNPPVWSGCTDAPMKRGEIHVGSLAWSSHFTVGLNRSQRQDLEVLVTSSRVATGRAGLAEPLSSNPLPDALPVVQLQADCWHHHRLTRRAMNWHVWLRTGYCAQRDEGEGHQIYFLLLVDTALAASIKVYVTAELMALGWSRNFLLSSFSWACFCIKG